MRPNQHQQEAIAYQGKHVLVLAGAGSGKTGTIINRVQYLLAQNAQPHRIALLTFTRRAAAEMTHRLVGLSGAQARQIQAGTFHNFCLRLMRAHPKLFGLQNYSVIDRDDQRQLMRLARLEVCAKKQPDFPTDSKLVDLFSYSRNTNQNLDAYLRKYGFYEEYEEAILAIAERYTARKHASHYLDFDDILYRFAKAVKQDQQVRERMKQKFDWLLVDEMQDTNPLQWIILSELCNPAKLFCVGDDAQSIYAFRGADFANVHSFCDRITEAEIIKLADNYRSTQPILDLANAILGQAPLDYAKDLRSVRGKGKCPRLITFGDRQAEADWIAEDIIARHEAGETYQEMMVIVRSSFASRAVEAALLEHRIPYRFVGGPSLANAAHVKDVFSACRAAISHTDEIAWLRFLTFWPKLGAKTAQKHIAALAKLESNAAVKAYLEKALTKYPDLIAAITQCQSLFQNPAQALQAATEALQGVLEQTYDNWPARKRDIDLLTQLATRHKNLGTFLETYTLEPISSSEARNTEAQDLLTLITVHSAKGSEARVCYLPQAQEGMYPHSRSWGDKDAEEEERRILYVAITRAKDELIISKSLDRQGYLDGGFPTRAENRYFLDRPEELPLELEDEYNNDYTNFGPNYSLGYESL